MVVLRNRNAPDNPRDLVLAATALALDGHTRLEWSGARFQSEVVCGDSTLCTGLTDGQARAAAARSGHVKAALATLHLGRAEDLHAQSGDAPRVFSLASGKPCQCNAHGLD